MDEIGIDIFLEALSYLPFDDVVSYCSHARKIHDYCINIKYNSNWKRLIDNTFSRFKNYDKIINELWEKLGYNKNTYNYMVYSQLVKFLDPITRLSIYYIQGDMKSIGNFKFKSDELNDINVTFLEILRNNHVPYRLTYNGDFLLDYFVKNNKVMPIKILLNKGDEFLEGKDLRIFIKIINKSLTLSKRLDRGEISKVLHEWILNKMKHTK